MFSSIFIITPKTSLTVLFKNMSTVCLSKELKTKFYKN